MVWDAPAPTSGLPVGEAAVEVRDLVKRYPQRPNLDRSLTAEQNLTFSAGHHGVPREQRRARAASLLERFGLGDRGADSTATPAARRSG